MDIAVIQGLVSENKIEWTRHALARMTKRNISRQQVINVLKTGEIIEEYPHDKPLPSCLIAGKNGIMLHVVCAIGHIELRVVTTYTPGNDKWLEDMKTRKEQS
jgi:hypothetical protein